MGKGKRVKYRETGASKARVGSDAVVYTFEVPLCCASYQ